MSRIDVMITCYNYGRFLRQCVESVLAQSHDDLRVLIVDDASTDDTAAICAELVKQDPRVEIVRHAVNLGHIATYNECIDLAAGDYMLLVDADDFLLPGALRRAIAVLDARPDVGLAPGSWVEYREGDHVPDSASDSPDAVPLDAAGFIERLSAGNFVGQSTAVARTSVQKRIGHYRPDLPHSGDLEMWLRFALHSRLAYIEAPQAAYRRHESNMSLNYGPAADLRQCMEAFLPHYGDIRRLPNGIELEARIRRQLVSKEQVLGSSAYDGGPEAITSSLAVIILNFKRPQNIGKIAKAAREALPEAAIFVLDQGDGDDLRRRGDIPWAEVWTQRAEVNNGAGARFMLASRLPFDLYIAIDDDTFLTPRQIRRLAALLQGETDRAHGIWGQRLELNQGVIRFRDGMTQVDAAVSILNQVYAFSRRQAVAAVDLSAQLGFASWHDIGPVDDILLSCASSKPPLCHDLGAVAVCPTSNQQGIAVWKSEGFSERRVEIARKLLAAQKIAVFSPLTYRSAPS